VILGRPFHGKNVAFGMRGRELVEELSLAGSDLHVGGGVAAEQPGPGEGDGDLVEVDVDHPSLRPR
jgi:hypothetical protein